MKKVTVFRIITAVLALILMCVIFSFSAQKAVESDKTSDGFITVICKTLVSRFSSLSDGEKTAMVKSLSFAVRKAAHMTEFAALGFFVCAFCGKLWI